MKVSSKGLKLIKDFEGLRLQTYVDSNNVLTIGYGHTVNVKPKDKITTTQAEALLKSDLQYFEKAVSKALNGGVKQNQFDALVSLAFNIGMNAFIKSSVLRLHNKMKYAEAAQAFSLWNRSGGKVMSGLVRRRMVEAALYLGNSDEEKKYSNVKARSNSRTASGITTTAIVGGVTAAAPTIPLAQDLISAAPWIASVLGIIILIIAGYFAWVWFKEKQEGRRT